MGIWNKMFGRGGQMNEPPQRIRLTRENLASWPKFQARFDQGLIRFDSNGRLRYSHGAPVGDLVLVRIKKDGSGVYKESTSEWFDPESPMAASFEWP